MISLNWIKDYIDLDGIDLENLAIDITKAGVNVEKVITNHIDNLVIGEIVECYSHPNSDHLNICKVDIGKIITQIVCGAKNVRKGLKVIVALPGAVLPGDNKISAGKIRGEESNGMICALFELGLEEKTEKNYNKGIYELPKNAPIGTDPFEYLGLDDVVYELDVHKHRNNDCYYHIGFAYEIATILNKKIKLPNINYNESSDSIKNYINLKVDTNKCSYYMAKMVKNVEIKDSPDFIKKRLISVGMRPINNVVDISNYVMLEYGQPMHFFDKDKLGNNILVRDAYDNEKITTLDGVERSLTSSDIVITDGNKPVCIAGVIGGLNTLIDNNTKNILIESAIFDPVNIRYTSKRLNLKTESSIRFGKGLNYEYTSMALSRACYLLEKYANATILNDIIIYDKVDKTPKKVIFKAEDINKMLGITISTNDMEKELDRLDFKYEKDNDIFTCIIPNRRLDIEPFVNDIAEEIGRLYGYHNLISTLPKIDIKRGEYIGDVKYRKLISKRLRSLGINEVKTYTLVSSQDAMLFDYEHKGKIFLPNPMSMDKSVIRTTLLPSLLNVYKYNKARKVEDIFLYEIAKTYDKEYNEDSKISVLLSGNYLGNKYESNKIKTDFYLAKGILENLLNYLGFKNRYGYQVGNIKDMHPGISAEILLDREVIGIIGRIHPSISKDDIYLIELSLNKLIKPIKKIKYKESNKYPEIKKDLSFIISNDTTCKEIQDIIKKSGGRLLSDVDLFDIYHDKENHKSLAYTLTFKADDRTLTDEEVMQIFNKIIDDVTNKCHAKLKSN